MGYQTHKFDHLPANCCNGPPKTLAVKNKTGSQFRGIVSFSISFFYDIALELFLKAEVPVPLGCSTLNVYQFRGSMPMSSAYQRWNSSKSIVPLPSASTYPQIDGTLEIQLGGHRSGYRPRPTQPRLPFCQDPGANGTQILGWWWFCYIIIYIYIHSSYNKIGMVSAILLVLSEFQRFVTELSYKWITKAPESNDHLIIYRVS